MPKRSGASPLVQALAWTLHTPGRAAAVALGAALSVLILAVAVIALAGGGRGEAAQSADVDRSSCRAVTTGFAQAFFADPTAAGWAERVGAWVESSLRDPVANIDISTVPSGTATLEEVDEQAGACDAWFTVAPHGMRVRVEASTTAGDGAWYVTDWAPE